VSGVEARVPHRGPDDPPAASIHPSDTATYHHRKGSLTMARRPSINLRRLGVAAVAASAMLLAAAVPTAAAAASGTIVNFAGSPAGTAGNTGDGGSATSALLNQPPNAAV